MIIGSANGHLYGRGFYTTSNITTAAAYAQSKGAICVSCIGIGNAKPSGSKEDTSGSRTSIAWPMVMLECCSTQTESMYST